MPHMKIQCSKQSCPTWHNDTQELVRHIKQEKNTLHTCEHHTWHYPSQSNIYCVLLFENSRKRAPSPSEGNANFVAESPTPGMKWSSPGNAGRRNCWRRAAASQALQEEGIAGGASGTVAQLPDPRSFSHCALLTSVTLQTAQCVVVRHAQTQLPTGPSPQQHKFCLVGKPGGPYYHRHQRATYSQAWNAESCAYNFSERTLKEM